MAGTRAGRWAGFRAGRPRGASRLRSVPGTRPARDDHGDPAGRDRRRPPDARLTRLAGTGQAGVPGTYRPPGARLSGRGDRRGRGSRHGRRRDDRFPARAGSARRPGSIRRPGPVRQPDLARPKDRKSTRLNSSHVEISYAVFCLKKKKKKDEVITNNKIKKKQMENKL